jgi:hypothetical protein
MTGEHVGEGGDRRVGAGASAVRDAGGQRGEPTALFVDLVDAWHAGAAVRARGLGHRLAPLSVALSAKPNPTVVKAVLHAV